MTISFYSPAQIIALMRAERQEVESELLNAYRYLTEQREGTQSHNLGKQRVSTLEQILKEQQTQARPANAGTPVSLEAVQRTLLVNHNELVEYLENYMGRLGQIEEEELVEGIQNLQQSVQRVCNLVNPETGQSLVWHLPGAVAKRLYIQPEEPEEPDPQGRVDFSKFMETADSQEDATAQELAKLQAQLADTYSLFCRTFDESKDPTGVSVDIDMDTAQVLMDSLLSSTNDVLKLVDARTGCDYYQAHPDKERLPFWEAE